MMPSRPLSFVLRFAAVAAWMFSLVSAPALAAPQGSSDKTPREYVDAAVAEFNLGHFAESAALFEKAYQLDPAPVLLFNMGQCHRRLGNNDRALFFYRRYLEQAPAQAPERHEVEQRIADLERSIRDQADLKDRPPPGVQRANNAGEAQSSNVADSSGAAPPEPPVPPAPAETHVASGTTDEPRGEVKKPSDDVSSRHTRRQLAWISAGVGAAALVFGGVEAIVWSIRAGRFNDHQGPSPNDPSQIVRDCGADKPNYGGEGCAALYRDGSNARTLTIVGLTAGGVAAVGSAILFYTSRPPADATTQSARWRCLPDFASRGVSCGLAF